MAIPLTWDVESFSLVLVVGFTLLMPLPYVLHRMFSIGLWGTLKTPQASAFPESGWAYRARRAHQNAVENLIVFAPLMLLVIITDTSNTITEMIATVYLLARVAHYFVYLLGIPVLRTLAYLVGYGATVLLFVEYIGWL